MKNATDYPHSRPDCRFRWSSSTDRHVYNENEVSKNEFNHYQDSRYAYDSSLRADTLEITTEQQQQQRLHEINAQQHTRYISQAETKNDNGQCFDSRLQYKDFRIKKCVPGTIDTRTTINNDANSNHDHLRANSPITMAHRHLHYQYLSSMLPKSNNYLHFSKNDSLSNPSSTTVSPSLSKTSSAQQTHFKSLLGVYPSSTDIKSPAADLIPKSVNRISNGETEHEKTDINNIKKSPTKQTCVNSQGMMNRKNNAELKNEIKESKDHNWEVVKKNISRKTELETPSPSSTDDSSTDKTDKKTLPKEPDSSPDSGLPSYTAMIAQAILKNENNKSTLSDIYEYMEKYFPSLEKRGTGWRNCVRHTLSLNDCFIKLHRPENGRSCNWAVHPSYFESFSRGDYRKRRALRKRPRGLQWMDPMILGAYPISRDHEIHPDNDQQGAPFYHYPSPGMWSSSQPCYPNPNQPVPNHIQHFSQPHASPPHSSMHPSYFQHPTQIGQMHGHCMNPDCYCQYNKNNFRPGYTP